MNLSQQVAKHFRDVHYGGNWTFVNLKDTLQGITWEQAITKVHSFNTIATLVFHMSYYMEAVLRVFNGGSLDAHDSLSFSHPPINNEEDWNRMLNKLWAEVDEMVKHIELIPEHAWWKTFQEEKYGTYYRNIAGMTEHTHYHMGQIVLIKKLLLENVVNVKNVDNV